MQYLYRAFTKDGTLLYVGISGRWSERLHQHEKESEWFERTDYVLIRRFPDRESVAAAEKAAIRAEKPIYNKQHSQEWQSPQHHFQQLKKWVTGEKSDMQHRILVDGMRNTFEEPNGLKPSRSQDVAWAFHNVYDYAAYHGYINCRNCEAISRHGMYESWAGRTDEELEARGYYD